MWNSEFHWGSNLRSVVSGYMHVHILFLQTLRQFENILKEMHSCLWVMYTWLFCLSESEILCTTFCSVHLEFDSICSVVCCLFFPESRIYCYVCCFAWFDLLWNHVIVTVVLFSHLWSFFEQKFHYSTSETKTEKKTDPGTISGNHVLQAFILKERDFILTLKLLNFSCLLFLIVFFYFSLNLDQAVVSVRDHRMKYQVDRPTVKSLLRKHLYYHFKKNVR